MPKIKKHVIDKLFEVSNILEVCQDFLPDLKKVGENWVCRSPLTDEKTASFNVVPKFNMFNDFSAQKSGKVYRFLTEYQNMKGTEPWEYLARKYNIKLEYEFKVKPEERDTVEDQQFKIIEWATELYKKTFWSEHHSKGRDYMWLKGFEEDILKEYNIGFAPDAWDFLLAAAKQDTKFTHHDLELAGLINRKKGGNAHFFDVFRYRVIFPITNEFGKVVGFGGRTLMHDAQIKQRFPEVETIRKFKELTKSELLKKEMQEKKQKEESRKLSARAKTIAVNATEPKKDEEIRTFAKYLNTRETVIFKKNHTVFGLPQAIAHIRAADKCYIVEGYTDVLAFASDGLKNVISSNGTAISIHIVQMVSRYTKNFVIVMDGDPAGVKATDMGIQIFLQGIDADSSVKVVRLPKKMDPQEYWMKNGPGALRKLVEETAMDFIEYKIDRKKDLIAGENISPQLRAKAINWTIRTICFVEDKQLRFAYFEQLADKTGLSMEVIQEEEKKIEAYKKVKNDQLREKQQRSRPSSGTSRPDPAPASVALPQRIYTQTETLLRFLLKFGNEKMMGEVTFAEYILHQVEAFNIPLTNEYLELFQVASALSKAGVPITRDTIIQKKPELKLLTGRLNGDLKGAELRNSPEQGNDISSILNSIRIILLPKLIDRASTEEHKKTLQEAQKTFPHFSQEEN